MILVITSQCNRDCSFCFEGPFRDSSPQRMSLADIENLCEFFQIAERPSTEPVTLLGGEPTLHPELIDIIDLIRDYSPRVTILLLTNLTCPTELTNELLRRRVNMLVNIVPPEENTAEQLAAIEANTDLLQQFHPYVYSVAMTITDPDQDFTFLYGYLRRDTARQVYNVRIGVSAPGCGFQNEFAKTLTPDWGEAYLRAVCGCHRINPRIAFSGECALNRCMMSEETYKRLEGVVTFLSMDCTTPNMDILPDMSTHWCFGLHETPEMCIENIFDFPNAKALQVELVRRKMAFARSMTPQCDFSECAQIACPGPCPALNLYRLQNGCAG